MVGRGGFKSLYLFLHLLLRLHALRKLIWSRNFVVVANVVVANVVVANVVVDVAVGDFVYVVFEMCAKVVVFIV